MVNTQKRWDANLTNRCHRVIDSPLDFLYVNHLHLIFRRSEPGKRLKPPRSPEEFYLEPIRGDSVHPSRCADSVKYTSGIWVQGDESFSKRRATPNYLLFNDEH